jgi:hypothetical protein
MSRYPDNDEQTLVDLNQLDFALSPHDISNLMSVVLLLIIIFPEEFSASVGYI